MRVATVDDLVTLFYDGSEPLYNQRLNQEWFVIDAIDAIRRSARLFNERYSERVADLEEWDVSDECKRYFRQRLSWQQIIIVDGVTEIPAYTFFGGKNIEKVIFADSVMKKRELSFLVPVFFL